MSDTPFKPDPPARAIDREARRLARLRRLRLVEGEAAPVARLRPPDGDDRGPKEAA